MHIHIASLDETNGSYVSKKFRKGLIASHFYSSLGINKKSLNQLSDLDIDNLVQEKFCEIINNSHVDKVMLLGLDGAYNESGTFLKDKTKLITSSNFLKNISKKSAKIIYAPSVHPYRLDALDELYKLKEDGVKVIKWIPAAQNIAPDNKLCIPFYETMKKLGLTLITHTCVEHAVVSFPQKLNDVHRLELPLSMGLNVIAAHCATNLFIYENSQYETWKKMMAKFPTLHGDISAFNFMTRVKYLKDIRKNNEFKDRVFYGSDFPIKSLPISFIFEFGIKKYLHLRRIENPIDKSLFITREFFGNDQILKNFDKFLKS